MGALGWLIVLRWARWLVAVGNRVSVRLVVAAGVLAVVAVGCGAAPSASAGALALVTSSSCSEQSSSSSPVQSGSCVFVLEDGRRFRCPLRFGDRATLSASVQHSKACVALAALVIPARSRVLFATIAKTRACLSGRGLRVTGGPVFPAQGSDSADGELIVGDAAGGALIAFYADGRKAQRLEPKVRQNAKRLGGQLERRGAVIVLWPHPSSPLSRSVEPCAFG